MNDGKQHNIKLRPYATVAKEAEVLAARAVVEEMARYLGMLQATDDRTKDRITDLTQEGILFTEDRYRKLYDLSARPHTPQLLTST
jgi:hypothetical protein